MESDERAFEQAIARLPRWILILALCGAAATGWRGGLNWAGGFLVGALASYFNFRLIERAVNRVARMASAEPGSKRTGAGIWVFIQFSALVLGAFVILRYSGFNMAAAFSGFFVCPVAAVLEILYELLTYGHS
jgi:ATP synthase I subunit